MRHIAVDGKKRNGLMDWHASFGSDPQTAHTRSRIPFSQRASRTAETADSLKPDYGSMTVRLCIGALEHLITATRLGTTLGVDIGNLNDVGLCFVTIAIFSDAK